MVAAALLVVAVAYAAGAGLALRRGRRHTAGSTIAFLTGLVVLAIALRSHWGRYDDETAWVHDTQHALLMCVAPPLLALGAPVTLALQVLPTRWARRLSALLHLPAVRALNGRGASVHAPLDYYGVMAVYLFSPVYSWSRDSAVVHDATHVVFLLCGLLFWVPVVGADVTGWRPSRRVALALVAAGMPVNALFALATTSVSLLVTMETATAFGLLCIACRPRRAVVRIPAQRAAAPAIAATPAPALPS